MAHRADSTLEHLIYLSQAHPSLRNVDVRSILGSAQVKNRRRDVTGFLLYSGHHFLQVLEGRSAELDTLAKSLQSDARHEGMRVLSREPIKQRRYGAWAMGFVESSEDAGRLDSLFVGEAPSCETVGGILERAARAY